MSTPSKLFIVEDNPKVAEVLVAYFQRAGYEVRHAVSGEEAVRLMQAEPPDVVLLDIRLPGIDGYEVCRRLRNGRRTQHVPIVFLTDQREREQRLAGLELGAVDYITKPFDLDELDLRVQNLFRRVHLESVQNSLTGLPAGAPVKEQLTQMFATPDWALIVVDIRRLNNFRDQYGFVAADDVVRAIGLMLRDAVADSGSAEAFLGHLYPATLFAVTNEETHLRLLWAVRSRIEPAVPFFYPALDWADMAERAESEGISVHIVAVTASDQVVQDPESLYSAFAPQFGPPENQVQ